MEYSDPFTGIPSSLGESVIKQRIPTVLDLLIDFLSAFNGYWLHRIGEARPRWHDVWEYDELTLTNPLDRRKERDNFLCIVSGWSLWIHHRWWQRCRQMMELVCWLAAYLSVSDVAEHFEYNKLQNRHLENKV